MLMVYFPNIAECLHNFFFKNLFWLVFDPSIIACYKFWKDIACSFGSFFITEFTNLTFNKDSDFFLNSY